MSNRDQSNRSNSNKASPWAVGLGAVALGAGAVAAVGGYLLGQSNAQEEAELAQLRQQYNTNPAPAGFRPSGPPKKPPSRTSSQQSTGATAVDNGAASASGSGEKVLQDADGNQECAICFRSYQELNKLDEEIHTTPCGHVFCYTCINSSLSERPKCPLCASVVRPGQTMRLFL